MTGTQKWATSVVWVLVGIFLIAAPVFSEEVVLKVGTGESGKESEWNQAVLDKFTEETGIKCELQTLKDDSYAAILTPALDAGKAPVDLLLTTWPNYLMGQAAKGHFLEVTDLVNEQDFMPGIIEPVKVDGKIYGATFTGGGKFGFWYRKSFFKANGLKEPESWDEFVALLEKMKQIEGIKAPIVSPCSEGWPLTDVTEHFLATFGGAELIYDLIANKVKWMDPVVKDIFEQRLVPLLEAGYFGEPIDWPVSNDLWWGNEYALQYMGSWVMGMVDDPADLGLITLPGAKAVVMGTSYWTIPAYTEHPEEAKKLFAFLTGPEAQIIHINQSIGKFATRTDVPESEYPEVTKVVANVLQGKGVVFDLDDLIGGEFKTKFYDGLKLLWVAPDTLEDMLEELDMVRED